VNKPWRYYLIVVFGASGQHSVNLFMTQPQINKLIVVIVTCLQTVSWVVHHLPVRHWFHAILTGQVAFGLRLSVSPQTAVGYHLLITVLAVMKKVCFQPHIVFSIYCYIITLLFCCI